MSPSPPDGARILGAHSVDLLSRIEDAGLNASAPPEQRWMDGWLVRTNPGKAQRARCINAVADGREHWQSKLPRCEALYRRLGLPLLVRITPFTRPADLDACLAAAGYRPHDDTRVMVMPSLDRVELPAEAAPPGGTTWRALDPDAYAESVGVMRGSTAEARRAHAARLRSSPVPYSGYALFDGKGEALACGQFAAEDDLVGLYDIATATTYQGRGLGTWLCKRLLTAAKSEAGSRSAYLQVGADNHTARRLYARLGFEDAYSYHYRVTPKAPPDQAARAAPRD
ncbi:MAG: GNAT family N-acetyltransferase [Rubrivivax sp.]|nr:GNAT family N-acetyltransferase [Rubrivivax sp.]